MLRGLRGIGPTFNYQSSIEIDVIIRNNGLLRERVPTHEDEDVLERVEVGHEVVFDGESHPAYLLDDWMQEHVAPFILFELDSSDEFSVF